LIQPTSFHLAVDQLRSLLHSFQPPSRVPQAQRTGSFFYKNASGPLDGQRASQLRWNGNAISIVERATEFAENESGRHGIGRGLKSAKNAQPHLRACRNSVA
jgi:hypothetical protein